MSNQHTNVLIIGSGPSGYTAAIYAARANLAPVLFAGLQPGGQLTITTDVENYPGFPEGVMGPDLMEKFKDQATRFGTKVVNDLVTKVDFSKQPYTIETEDSGTWTADSVIISTGATARLLGLQSEKNLMGHGVSACATCDGFFFRDKEVAVVGGGDTAMEEALFLTRFCKKVTVIHRREELRASKIMQQRALNHDKIDFLWNSEVAEVLGTKETGITGLKLKNTVSGDETEYQTEGLFIAIGHKPNTELFTESLELDDAGYIKVAPGAVSTKYPGVFACGDVIDHKYRQAITAAGTGCMAAIDAERYLETIEVEKEAVSA